MDYKITNTITAEEYLEMRALVGWGSFPLEQAKAGFYKKFGFIERPNEDFGPGMHQWICSEEEN